MIPELSQLTGVEISIYLAIAGAILLYFGKVISDTKVEKYDKLGYYIEGLIFFAIYIFIPFVLVYYLKNWFEVSFWILFLTQITVLGCLLYNIKANEYFRKLGLLEEFKKRCKDKISEIKLSNSLKGKMIRKYDKLFKDKFGMDYVELSVLAFYKIPIKFFGNNKVLFLFSFLTIFSSFYFFELGNFLFFVISLIFTFFTLTMTALAYGFGTAYYPPAKILLNDGTTIECKILKFGDFVYCLKKDKKIFINKDKIKYVEENLFKEKQSD